MFFALGILLPVEFNLWVVPLLTPTSPGTEQCKNFLASFKEYVDLICELGIDDAERKDNVFLYPADVKVTERFRNETS